MKELTLEEWVGKDNKLGVDVFNKKYRHNDETFDNWLNRVSGKNIKVREMIVNKKAIFGGRVLANRGTGLSGGLTNCYVLPSRDIDSIDGILEQCKRMANTFKHQGGLGFDLSAIRPRGSYVNGDKTTAPGAISFMPLFSSVTGTIASGGRRGASLLFINARHPDAIEFCECKRNKDNGITNANISLMVDDEFMEKAKNGIVEKCIWKIKSTGQDFEYELDYKAVIDSAVQGGLIGAEPACLFKDHYINNAFTQHIKELEFTGVNGCSEFSGTDWSACMLASMNVSQYIKNKKFMAKEFFDDTKEMFNELNKVLKEGFEYHPYQEMRDVARNQRQVGMGITGIADALIKLGITYGTKESKDFVELVGEYLLNACVQASALQAKEDGSFEHFDIDKVAHSMIYKKLWYDTKELVEKHGMYNSRLVAVAPQGSGSLLLGCSSGIEPIYKRAYQRRTQSLHGTSEDVIYTVIHQPIVEYMSENNLESIPSHCVEAHDINWKDKIDIIASLQKYCDNAISNTTNLPKGTTFEELKDIYFYGHSVGCKGISVYVDGSLDSQVLFDDTDTESVEKDSKKGLVMDIDESLLVAKRVKLKHGCGKFTAHVYFYNDKVFDVFVSTKQAGCIANIQTVAVTYSLLIRMGMSLAELKRYLSGVSTCASFAVAKSKDFSMDMTATSCGTMLINKLIEMENAIQQSDIKNEIKLEKIDNVNIDVEGLPCKVCGHIIEIKENCTSCPKCHTVNCG